MYAPNKLLKEIRSRAGVVFRPSNDFELSMAFLDLDLISGTRMISGGQWIFAADHWFVKPR